MGRAGRFGSLVLLAGGLALAGLMLYALGLDPGSVEISASAGELSVAIVVPERGTWLEFLEAVTGCQTRGVLDIVRAGEDSVTIRTPRRHLVRMFWHPARGVVETREAAARLVERASPPAAVVGSVNTALTVALADALRQSSTGMSQNDLPLLLIPWATSSMVKPRSGEPIPLSLLSFYPGRSYRFCPDNNRLADLLVRCVGAREEGRRPAKVLVLEDTADPYSVDLARSFQSSMRKHLAGIEIEVWSEGVFTPGVGDTPGPVEQHLAERIWAEAKDLPQDREIWLVLPLQGEPIRRVIEAIREGELSRSKVRLQILCGDGIGLESLSRWTGKLGFGVWCVSAGVPGGGWWSGPASENLVLAEIVTALVRSLDEAGGDARKLQAELGHLIIEAGEKGLPRSLAFDEAGEREGEDLGHVLAILAGDSHVTSFTPSGSGKWMAAPAIPARPATASVWPWP